MLTGLRWLALEVKDLDRSRLFYEEHVDLDVRRADDDQVRLAAGEQDLVLRRPGSVPRGGLHTHYAMAIPREEYDGRFSRLAQSFDLEEHSFGSARSLYFYDPAGNCVELGERDVDGPGVDRIFEIVLEVLDLGRAETFYRNLGFEVVDRGSTRRRVRLAGPVELELWEPHLGLANARGGVHVDLGFVSSDPEGTIAPVEDRVCAREAVDGGVRVRDPDGHWVTVLATA